MIIVDTNEASANDRIVSDLKEIGVCVKIEKLEVGDYFIPYNNTGYLIERKTSIDFVNSMISGRLFKQLKNLKEQTNVNPILLLEGNYVNVVKFSKVPMEVMYGLMLSVLLDWDIKIVYSHNRTSTIKLLYLWDKRIGKGKSIYPLRFVKKNVSDYELVIGVIEGFPMISGKRAKDLLSYFGSLKNMINADVEQLMCVEGIGKTIAKRIFDLVNKKWD